VVYGVVLRGNTIINYEDPQQPFLGTLQGIGCFDGMFEGWRVENNVVMTDHWHGITLSGATDCIIVNNTVVDLNENEPGPPWVRFSDHKDGRPSTGCIIRNNLTTNVNSSSEGVTVDHNVIIENYENFFVDYAGGDLRLKPGCSAIDAGTSEGAPVIDRAGNPRPEGGGIDAGAYEYSGEGVISTLKKSEARAYMTVDALPYGLVFSFREPVTGTITLFNLKGKKCASILCSGTGKIVWGPQGVSNGTFLCCFTGKKNFCMRRVVLMQ
jgi:hypothetical protein